MVASHVYTLANALVDGSRKTSQAQVSGDAHCDQGEVCAQLMAGNTPLVQVAEGGEYLVQQEAGAGCSNQTCTGYVAQREAQQPD